MAEIPALELQRQITLDWQAHSTWRDRARHWWDMYHGTQWTDAERSRLIEEGRVPMIHNRIAPTVDAVAGSEIRNRVKIKFMAREPGDAGADEVMSAAGEWFRGHGGETAESQAFLSMLVCGLGWTLTRVDTDADPQGEPEISAIDPLQMGWDRRARAGNLRDAERVFRVRRMPMRRARELFPDADPGELRATWLGVVDAPERTSLRAGEDYPRATRSAPTSDPDEGSDAILVQCQWIEYEDVLVAADPQTGGTVELSPERLAMLEAQGVAPQTQTTRRRKRKQAFFGLRELTRMDAPSQDAFSFQSVTGRHDGHHWYGMVRAMVDPQRTANQMMGEMLHLISTSSRAGVMVETGAVEDPQRFANDWAASDRIAWLRDGALASGAITPKPATPFPAGLDAIMARAIQAIPDVTGVNLEMLGLRDTQQPGMVAQSRHQSALTLLSGYFDSLRAYRQANAELIMDIVLTYLSDGRLIRLVGEDLEQYVPLVRQPNYQDYDVIVDETPASATMQEQTWAFLQQVLPTVGNMLSPEDWLDIMKYSPLPGSVLDRIKKRRAEQAEAPPDPAQEMAREIAMRAEAAKVAEDEAGAALDQAKAERERLETEILRLGGQL